MEEPLTPVDADLLERARAAAADHPDLVEALSKLDGLGELGVEHHPGAFDVVHQLLRSALDDAT